MTREHIPHTLRERARRTAGIAGTVARAGARRIVRKLEEDDRLFGEALMRELDDMKGMAMKVGQILSYMDGALPAETQVALRKLQRGVTPLAFSSIAPVIEEALGAPVRERFAMLDEEAVAAASIGQVHRGALLDGREVAVKVQYPHVIETFEADVTQLRRLARVASAATRVDGLAIVEDVRARLHEECDYTFEARWLEHFAHAFADTPGIAFPEVIDSHSAQTVLTTTWCAGVDFYTFCEEATDAARQDAARALMRFALTSLFRHGAFNADPHPGNYLFASPWSDGAAGIVTFLDFGCVRVVEEAWLEPERRIARALLEGDRAGFRDAVLDSGVVAVRPARFDFDAYWDMLSWQWAPYLTDSFSFDDRYMEAGVQYTRPSNANLRKLAISPEWVWVERLRWGLHAVLTRLGARGDFRGVLHEALDGPLRPLRDVA